MLACSEALFIIKDIIADEGLDKKGNPYWSWPFQVDIVTITYGCWHSIILPYQNI